jgi:protoporphyrinogen/coproporphyrinogen III oxidase
VPVIETRRDDVSRERAAYDVVVVGAGIAGLAAAWELRDHDVLVLESEARIGGRIWSERRGDYWLNFGAHVFGSPGTATGRLLADTGVHAVQVPGRLAAASLGGRIVAGGPVELFPFRLPMPVRSRLALVRAGIKLRRAVERYSRIAAPRPGEEAAERQDRMLSFLDDRSFSEFIGPLPEDVDALFRSTLTRSSGEPEVLAAGYGIGYFHLVWNRSEGLSRNIIGGSSVLVEALARGVGDRIRTATCAISVRCEGDGVRVRYLEGAAEREVRARAAVVATPAHVSREILHDLPAETAAALERIPYGPYVVAAFLTREQRRMPWDEIYALATPKRSFGMLFNTANVLRADGRPRSAGGSLMVYAAADAARRLARLDDGAIAARFVEELHDLLPETRDIVEETVIRRWDRGLPYPLPGRSRLQGALTRSLAPIYLAGDYLGTWYTETAVQTAALAAMDIRRRLGSETRASRQSPTVLFRQESRE